MLSFSDLPYTFHPAKPNRLLIAVSRQWNRYRSLPGPLHRIRSVRLVNPEVFGPELRRPDARVLFLPNHSTHNDPQIMAEVQRRLGRTSMYMAAHDVFGRGRWLAWIMQRLGTFSVDREGSDRQSMKAAVEALVKGRYALTIFPEGNVYFMNDRVAPFLDGAAYLALKAQAALGDAAQVQVVPVSIKVTHMTDAREGVRGIMERVATAAGTAFDAAADVADEFKRIGLALLSRNLVQRGYALPGSPDGDVRALLEQAAEAIIQALEAKVDLSSRPRDNLTDRIRKIRRAIHQVRTEPEREADHAVAATWADEAMLALRILSYAGDYMVEKTSLDRCGETAEKFFEDAFSRAHPPYADREAQVYLNRPIALGEYLAQYNQKARAAVQQLTEACEQAVLGGLDQLNQANTQPGSQPWAP